MKVVISKPSIMGKFFDPTVERGQTLWPKTAAEQLQHGIRFDYDGIVTHKGKLCHKYQVQPNSGKIPNTIKLWREKRGTHSVITDIYVPIDTEPAAQIMEESSTEAFDHVSL